MQITRAGDYGIRGMIYLAQNSHRTDMGVAEIARECNLPASFLAKIFRNLAKAKLVKAHRGAKGGYNLTKPSEEITVLEIIEGIEGPISLNRCIEKNENCGPKHRCCFHEIVEEAQKELIAAFKKYTLKDLI